MRRTLGLFGLILFSILIAGVVDLVPAKGQGGTPPSGAIFPLICSTTDYTTIAATALGMTAAEVRLAMVSGQTLQDIATGKNVDFQKVVDAIMAVRNADIQQAVKDGLISSGQAASMMTPIAPLGNGGDNPVINITTGAGSFPYGVGDHNLVNPFVVVATTVSMSCPDLYIAVQGGQSVVRIVVSKKASVSAVIDDLLKVYTSALDQDVKDALITQEQADAKVVPMTESILTMVGSPGGLLKGGPGGGLIPVLPAIPGSGNKSPKPTSTATS